MTAVRLPAAQRRQQLLDVALEVFARQGFHETSMRDLAEQAGVSKPVLYQHFPSKQDLYVELLTTVTERLIARLREATSRHVRARDRVEAGLGTYIEFVTEQRTAVALLFGGGAPRDEASARAMRRTQAAIGDAIANLLGDEIDEGKRQMTAHGLVGLAEGVVRWWTSTGRQLPAEHLSAMATSLVWGGLADTVGEAAATPSV